MSRSTNNHVVRKGKIYHILPCILTIVALCSTCINSKYGNLISILSFAANIHENIIWLIILLTSMASFCLCIYSIHKKDCKIYIKICFIINIYYILVSLLTVT